MIVDRIKEYIRKKILESQLCQDKIPMYNYSALNPIYSVQVAIIKVYGKFWDKLRIDGINVEKEKENIKIILSTERPGLIIGKGGRDMDRLKEELSHIFGSEISLDIR